MTEEDKARAIQLRAEGLAYYKIATMIGRSDSTVAKYLQSLGDKSNRFGWTAEKEACIVALFRAGHSIKAIRGITGIGHTAISHKLSDLGVRKYNYAPRHETNGTRVAKSNEGSGWDSRTFLPYADWKRWNQQRRAENAERV